MDEISKTRLRMRHQKLSQIISEIRNKFESGQIAEEDLLMTRLKLRQFIEAFDKELRSSSEHLEVSEFTEYMNEQLEAEEWEVKLNSVAEMYVKTNAPKPSSSSKLPKLELAKFNGDILQWSEFWDRFEANIDSKELKDVEKLAYLLSSLEGQALETVSGLSTTNANYAIALEVLQKRFGSKDRVIDAHHTAIGKIKVATDKPASCRLTLDMVEKHLRVLQTLGENIESNHLRTAIASKFPEQIIYQVNILSSNDHSVPALRSSLDKVITAMERSGLGSDIRTVDNPPLTTTEALQVRVEHDNRKNTYKRKGGNFKQNKEVPNKRPRRPCIFCGRHNHVSSDCKAFKTIEARKEKLKNKCFKCLKEDHKSKECKRKISCYNCKGNHLKCLCPKPIGENYNVPSVPIQAQVPTIVFNASNKYTYLQTAVATIKNPKNEKHNINVRILLDSGSQRSYITAKAAKDLELPMEKKDLLLVYTFGAATPQEMSSPTANIIITTKRGISRKIQVNIVPRITDRVPVAKLKHNKVDIPADDDTVGENIDVLVGNDFYCSFLRDEDRIKVDARIYLLDTDFGWVLSGSTSQLENDVLSVTTYCQCHVPSCPYLTEPDLPLRNIDIKFLWSLESIGITDSPKATRQEQAVRHFNETVQYQNGRYEVKWPWIQYPPEIQSNFGLAIGRLRSLIKKLDDGSMTEYNSILKEQLDLGIIEVIEPSSSQTDHPIHYLPHHMVKQRGKRGRLVYDASAKTTGQKSLNECLYSGPSMLEDLTALLLNFRTKRIGIIADVEKAFLQVGLQQEDRDVTRFLWIKDPNQPVTDDNLLHLRFCRVPFGIISSPFLLTATIRHHMTLSNENLLKTIANKCYVDNLVTGAESVQEASRMYVQTRSTFGQLSMNIRDWVSNCKQFMDTIPQQHKAAQCEEMKVLGLSWDVQKDMLKLKVSENHFDPDTPINTKREVLRTLARVYDPCGFVCPLILPIKLLFQNICKEKVKWDVPLPENLTRALEKILLDLKAVTETELPRYIGIDVPGIKAYELHCFTDASKHAYAAVVYLKTKGDQQTSVSLVMAKSRISQIEDRDDLKIPKLELLGFLIGSRLLKYVKANLNLPIEKEYLWTDSQIVLAWIKSNKLLPPFVANRVNEIKRHHQQTEMCYVNTKSNPADIATRPEPELWDQRKELWYNGPEFLKDEESQWPMSRHYCTDRTFVSFGEALEGSPGELEPHDWSELTRIQNVPMEIEDLQEENTSNDSSQDNTSVQIKKIQLEHFPDELAGKKTHLVKSLDLFVDSEGLLRCGGRMANTTWDYDMKYPVLLPRDCEFTNKIIIETHESNYHVGASHTLSIIRRKYWIPQGRAKVTKMLKTCQQCVKHGGGPYKLPDTPALPPERVNFSEPFSFTGVDYFGPLYVSTATGKEKRWVSLFTCLAVRAVHLEIVKDLSAQECLLALRRFAATRGIPKRMYSDNATCFKLTSEVMTSQYCIDTEIKWKFIPQLAPWHGGFYERLVGLVKHCLKRTLGKHLLSDSKLLTVMKEVEAVINSRPLTRVGTEVEHILRPADFLTLGKCLMAKPSPMEAPCTGSRLKSDLIESWKKGIKILEEFKKMFIGQYLTCLRERTQHSPKQPRIKSDRVPQVGDVVQIKADSKNRQNWKVGKVIDLIEGVDGACRVARVKVDDSIFTRSIGHLYPLEESYEESPQPPQIVEQEPRRYSARLAEEINPDFESFQVQGSEIQSCDQTTASGPEKTSQIETEPVCEADDSGLNNNLNDRNIPLEDFSPGDEAEESPLQENEVEGRSRRGAAIRAREKILEWTRHLLALLE